MFKAAKMAGAVGAASAKGAAGARGAARSASSISSSGGSSILTGVAFFLIGVWLIAISGTALECYDINKNFKPKIAKYKDNRTFVQVSLGLSFVVLLIGLYKILM